MFARTNKVGPMRDSDTPNATFDYARLLAVVGIIWFHAKAPGGLIGYSGLAFFLMLLSFNAWHQIIHVRAQFHRAPAWTRYATARAQRLLLPWLVASSFYGGFKILEIANGSPWASEFSSEMWITGTAQHLWFLPFAFMTCVVIWPLARWSRDQDAPVQMVLSFVFAGLAMLAIRIAGANDLPVPFAQWAYAVPSVFLGLSIALTGYKKALLQGILALFVLTALALDLTSGLFEIAIAGCAMLLCLQFQLPRTTLSAQCGRMSLWIYLIHPAIMSLIVRGAGLPEGTVALAILTTVISVAIVAVWETLKIVQIRSDGLKS